MGERHQGRHRQDGDGRQVLVHLGQGADRLRTEPRQGLPESVASPADPENFLAVLEKGCAPTAPVS